MEQISFIISFFMIGATSFILGDCLISYIGFFRRQVNSRSRYSQFLVIAALVLDLLILDTASNIYRAVREKPGEISPISEIGLMVSLVLFYVIIGLFVLHIISYISRYNRVPGIFRYFVIGFCITETLMWLTSIKTGLIFCYTPRGFEHGPLYPFGVIGGIMCAVVGVYVVVRYKGPMRIWEEIMLIAPFFFPMGLMVIRVFVKGLLLMPSALALGIALYYSFFWVDEMLVLRNQQDRLNQDKIDLMKSQIKPHFMYNTLNSIYVLCEEDPEAAQKTIADFSEYLRANMESLDCEDLIPFTKELEHTRYYLEIEKTRFQEILQVEYDLEATDFLVPSLTLQPIVENAVKHGVTRRKEGGTIRISSRKKGKNHDIVVEDDGVGFLPEQKKSSEEHHVGIDNVKERLWLLCRGTMEIESTPGKGTKVSIHIPLKKYQSGGVNRDENHRDG